MLAFLRIQGQADREAAVALVEKLAKRLDIRTPVIRGDDFEIPTEFASIEQIRAALYELDPDWSNLLVAPPLPEQRRV